MHLDIHVRTLQYEHLKKYRDATMDPFCVSLLEQHILVQQVLQFVYVIATQEFFKVDKASFVAAEITASEALGR